MKNSGKIINGFLIGAAVVALSVVGGCGKKSEESAKSYSSKFSNMSDSEKVAYVMRTCTPDSVARFVMNAALGRIKGVEIDTLAMAELYVYSNYDPDKQDLYAEEATRLKEQLSLAQKMELFKKGSTDDPVSFGLDLGLSYLTRVRENNMSVKDIDKEIKEFRKICGEDTATYRRFVTGFTEALRQDKDKDVKKEVYEKFINLQPR
ncbi:MAG: hypothetical protein K2N05_00500 [Muribaculaceae bacterium]|nr:hypothetical protein [Muribaculaceae bacterium]